MRRTPLRLLLVGVLAAVLLTGGVVAVGTVAADEEAGTASQDNPFRTTALEELDASGLAVRRGSFCSAIDPRQVAAALGTDPESERSWDNGDRVEVSDGVRDVVHEFGCEYAGGGRTARAWVFAPPVDRRRAKQLARAVTSEQPAGHCSGMMGTRFGDPSVARFCTGPESSTASYHGLFGDAWLSCELTSAQSSSDSQELDDQAGRWCVGVALAAGSEPTEAS